MNKSFSVALAAVVVCSFISIGASAVEFDEANYVAGPLGQHKSWNASSAFCVEAGSVSMSTLKPYQSALWCRGVSGDSISAVLKFKFTAIQTSAWKDVFGIKIWASKKADSSRQGLYLRTLSGHKFDLLLGKKGSADFTAAAAGIPAGGGASQWLVLRATFTRGADASDWTVQVDLSNAETATELVNETWTQVGSSGNGPDLFEASAIYAGFGTGKSGSGVTDIKVDTFTVTGL